MADTLRRRRQGVRFDDDDDEDYDAVKQGSDDDDVRRRPTAAKVFAARKSLGYDASSDDEDAAPTPPAPKWAERVVAVVDAVVIAAAPYADKAMTLAEDAVAVAAPVARRAYGVAAARVTREGLAIATGLFVCLFGGSFVRLIAVAEALHVTGAYATAAAALAELREHVEVVAEAEKTDGRRKSMAVLRKERQCRCGVELGAFTLLCHPPTHAIDAGFYADTSASRRGRFRSTRRPSGTRRRSQLHWPRSGPRPRPSRRRCASPSRGRWSWA